MKVKHHNKTHAGEKLTPSVSKTVDLLLELCKDGKPHDNHEVIAFLKEHGSNRKYLSKARLVAGVTMSKQPDGTALYQLEGQKAAEDHPQLSQSSKLLGKKTSLELQTVREKLEAQVPGYDPVVALAQIGSDLTVPLSVRLEIHQTLLKYLVPQVKAAEVTTTDQPIALRFKWGKENDDKGPPKVNPKYKEKMI